MGALEDITSGIKELINQKFDELTEIIEQGEKSKKYMKINEVDEYLPIGIFKIRELLQLRKIPAKKIGKYWIFEKSKLDAWYKNLKD